jgi:ATP synthase protein I
MARGEGSKQFDDFDARVRKLRADARLPDPEAEEGRPGPPRMVGGAGVQVGIELFAGVAGGALIGYGLDRWLGTWPFLFLVMFFLGAAGGMLNAWRYIRRMSQAAEEETRARKDAPR